MATRSQNQKIFYGWWIVVLLFFTLINTAGYGFYSFSVYVPRLIEAFECSTSNLMLTGALWPIVFGFSNPWIGSMIQKHGVRKIFISGVMAGGILMLLMSLMTELWHLFILNIFAGLAAAATILIPSQTLITNWFNKRRGIAMALMMMGIGAGGFLIPQLVAWLIEQFGWRQAFRIGAAINYLVVLPPLLFFLKNKPADVGQVVDGLTSDSQEDHQVPKVVGLSSRKAVSTSIFWLIIAMYILQLFVMSGIGVNVQNFAEKEMGYSIRSATHFMAFALFVTIPARFLFGFLSDRFDPKYLMGSAGFFFLGSSFVLWFFVVEQGWVNDYRAIALFALFQGFGIAGNAVILPILVGRCFGEREFSKIIGLVMSSFAVGVLLGPYITGKIYDVTGTYQGAFQLTMLVSAASLLLAPFIKTNSLRAKFTAEPNGKPTW